MSPQQRTVFMSLTQHAKVILQNNKESTNTRNTIMTVNGFDVKKDT